MASITALNSLSTFAVDVQPISSYPRNVQNQKEFQRDTGYSWLIVLGSFVMQSCCYGLPLAFGIFQDYYTSSSIFKNSASSYISIIGTVCLAIMGLGSSVSGKLMDYLSIKAIIVLGTFFVVSSQIIASFSTQVWHLILTQGVMLGIGCGILYIPSNVVVSYWVEKRRGLAYGISSAGSGLGTLFYSEINSLLLQKLGFNWTLRIDGFIILVKLLFCLFIIKSHPSALEGSTKNKKFEFKQVLNMPFLLLCIAMLLFACSYPTTLFYLPNQVTTAGFSTQQASAILSIVSGLSAGGRIIVGFIADYMGHVNVYIVCNVITTASYVFLFIKGQGYGMYVGFGVIFGLFGGGLVGSFGSVVTALFGTKNINTIMGLSYAPTGIGELIGPPISGVLMDKYKDYQLVNIFTCCLMGASCIAIIIIRMMQFIKSKSKTESSK